MLGLDADLHRAHLLTPLAVPARAVIGAAATLLLLSPLPSEADPTSARPWLDAPLGYLVRTEDELGVDVAVLLRIVGQLTGDSRAIEVSEIRRLGFTEREIGLLAPLFALELPVLPPAPRAVAPIAPAPLPPEPPPAARTTADGRRANAVTCLEPAASCRLAPGCVDWATDPRLAGLELTHQAAWLLFVRWRSCPLAIDAEALQRSLAGRLLGELALETRYSETHLERLATLGQLGSADRFEPEWLRTILRARSPAGCWGAAPEAPCHPHPTALALWALALAERAGRWPGHGAGAN